MARRTARLVGGTLVGQEVAFQIQEETNPPIPVRVPLVASESEEEFRLRARQAALGILVRADHAARRGARFAGAADQITLTLDRPDPPTITRIGARLSGTVAPGTAALLLVLRDPGGATRQVRVTPTRPNDPIGPPEFSVALGEWVAVTLTPVGPEGLLGTDQAVP